MRRKIHVDNFSLRSALADDRSARARARARMGRIKNGRGTHSDTGSPNTGWGRRLLIDRRYN